MRNLSTGWLVYLYPSGLGSNPGSVSKLYTHIHGCRNALSALKQSLWPRVFYYLIQLTGQAPVMWPIPYGLTGTHFVRERLIVPLIRFALQSCKWSHCRDGASTDDTSYRSPCHPHKVRLSVA